MGIATADLMAWIFFLPPRSKPQRCPCPLTTTILLLYPRHSSFSLLLLVFGIPHPTMSSSSFISLLFAFILHLLLLTCRSRSSSTLLWLSSSCVSCSFSRSAVFSANTPLYSYTHTHKSSWVLKHFQKGSNAWARAWGSSPVNEQINKLIPDLMNLLHQTQLNFKGTLEGLRSPPNSDPNCHLPM